jgi:hypothetical protein
MIVAFFVVVYICDVLFTKVSYVNEKSTTLDDIVHQVIADEKLNKKK